MTNGTEPGDEGYDETIDEKTGKPKGFPHPDKPGQPRPGTRPGQFDEPGMPKKPDPTGKDAEGRDGSGGRHGA